MLSVDQIEKIIGDIHYDLLGTGTPNGKFHRMCAEAIKKADSPQEPLPWEELLAAARKVLPFKNDSVLDTESGASIWFGDLRKILSRFQGGGK